MQSYTHWCVHRYSHSLLSFIILIMNPSTPLHQLLLRQLQLYVDIAWEGGFAIFLFSLTDYADSLAKYTLSFKNLPPLSFRQAPLLLAAGSSDWGQVGKNSYPTGEAWLSPATTNTLARPAATLGILPHRQRKPLPCESITPLQEAITSQNMGNTEQSFILEPLLCWNSSMWFGCAEILSLFKNLKLKSLRIILKRDICKRSLPLRICILRWTSHISFFSNFDVDEDQIKFFFFLYKIHRSWPTYSQHCGGKVLNYLL